MKKFITGFLLIILSSFAFGEFVSVKVGDKIPNFKINSLDGKNQLDTTKLEKKQLLINFTASWCPTCIEEKKEFQKDYVESLAKNKDLEVIVIFGDYGKETMDSAKKYIKDNNYTYPSYYDKNRTVAALFGLKSVPTNILVDKDGTILEITSKYNLLKNLNNIMKK
ncbi:MAG: TlpA family protein disulfide reductase [Fusobacteriaceae bacterium]